ncbi:MAG: hypothetical protein E4G98_06810 [Promethearchaeota archaeon]|nr:MAG: hypothetical protein E4G98_06810 [Candidatus Lokiarchaeota archaeon]
MLNPSKDSPDVIFVPQGAGNWFYCPHCNTFQDRDVNAAYNLAKYNALIQNSARSQLLLDRLDSESSERSDISSLRKINSLADLINARYIVRKKGLERVKISLVNSVRYFFTNVVNAYLGMGTLEGVIKWTNDRSIYDEFRSLSGYSTAILSVNRALAKIYSYSQETSAVPIGQFQISEADKNNLLSENFYKTLFDHTQGNRDFYTANPKLKWFPDNILKPNEDPPPSTHHQPVNAPS